MGARAMDTVRLYRAVLKSATKFPSKNKMAIVEEIKVEFRQKRELTDAKEIEKAGSDGARRFRSPECILEHGLEVESMASFFKRTAYGGLSDADEGTGRL